MLALFAYGKLLDFLDTSGFAGLEVCIKKGESLSSTDMFNSARALSSAFDLHSVYRVLSLLLVDPDEDDDGEGEPHNFVSSGPLVEEGEPRDSVPRWLSPEVGEPHDSVSSGSHMEEGEPHDSVSRWLSAEEGEPHDSVSSGSHVEESEPHDSFSLGFGDVEEGNQNTGGRRRKEWVAHSSSREFPVFCTPGVLCALEHPPS